MMLIALSSALLVGIQWFCHKWRENRYAVTMSRVLNRVSLLVQKCQSSRINKYETASIFKTALSLGDAEMSMPPSELVLKDDFLVMHEMKSWATIDLSSWITDGYNSQKVEARQVSILLEAIKVDGTKASTESSNLMGYHILTFGRPVAWKTDGIYGLILACDDAVSLVQLVDAFGQRRLTVTEGLEVTSLATVRTTGYPKAFSKSKTLFSPAEDKEENFPVPDTEPPQIDEPKPPAPSLSIPQLTLSDFSSVEKVDGETHVISEEKILSENGHISSEPKALENKDLSSKASKQKSSTSIMKSNAKPPNVLIYCGTKDTKRKFEEVCDSLKGCINTDSYTVYHLTHEHVLSTPWQENTAALVISACSRLQPDVENKVKEFVFNQGGSLLNFGSSADNFFEGLVELVKNTKGQDMTTFDFKEWKKVTSCCGQYLYSNCGKDVSVVVPASDEQTERKDAALIVKMDIGQGRNTVVLSQVFVEQDPVCQATDKASFDVLKKSNNSRLAVLRELLALVGLDTHHAAPPNLTSCHLLTQNQKLKESFLSSFKSRLQDGVLKSKVMSLSFPTGSPEGQSASLCQPRADFLPVLTETMTEDAVFEYFNMTDYWSHLKTQHLGRIVMYTDVISSTMPVFDGCLFSLPKDISPVAIAGRQVQGKGRGGNQWLSPCGCAMYTLPLQFDLDSPLGQRSSFLQHLVSLAVVRGVLSLPGYQDLDLRLKWPNDIYYGREMKLGGVLVQSTVMGSTIYATIGCGVNVSNSDPTICINDVIQQHNTSHPDLSPLPPLTTGQVIACALTSLEQLIADFNTKGHEYIAGIYCKHWMHTGCKVKVDLDTKCEGEIVGVDDYGFLSIRTLDGGRLISVQPDGNSFDMMHNLIHFKGK